MHAQPDHRNRLTLATAMVTILVGLCCAEARAQDADVVIEWNRLLQRAITTPGALPATVFVTRPYALTHAAMFDALNAFDRRYTSLGVDTAASSGASRAAAVSQAAHDVLSALFPTLGAEFDAAHEIVLQRLPGAAARDGARLGAEVARQWLERRNDDGWSRTPPDYLLPSIAGYYQVTPPQNARAGLTHYPDVVPFVIGSARQFLPGPPPALTSERYTTDFNEAKALGGTVSSVRTADQTLVAQLWASVGNSTPWHVVWQNVARDVSRSRGLGDLETARLFALMNIAIHDGLLTSFTGKYLYGLWRPVTAVRGATDDGNPNTAADLTWTSLVPSPPYPTYPGNMACIGAASSRVLARFFGRDDIAFTATWTLTAGGQVTRRYNGFREMGDESARSRVYGGIHFTFDTLASMGVCQPLADYVFDNAARTR